MTRRLLLPGCALLLAGCYRSGTEDRLRATETDDEAGGWTDWIGDDGSVEIDHEVVVSLLDQPYGPLVAESDDWGVLAIASQSTCEPPHPLPTEDEATLLCRVVEGVSQWRLGGAIELTEEADGTLAAVAVLTSQPAVWDGESDWWDTPWESGLLPGDCDVSWSVQGTVVPEPPEGCPACVASLRLDPASAAVSEQDPACPADLLAAAGADPFVGLLAEGGGLTDLALLPFEAGLAADLVTVPYYGGSSYSDAAASMPEPRPLGVYRRWAEDDGDVLPPGGAPEFGSEWRWLAWLAGPAEVPAPGSWALSRQEPIPAVFAPPDYTCRDLLLGDPPLFDWDCETRVVLRAQHSGEAELTFRNWLGWVVDRFVYTVGDDE